MRLSFRWIGTWLGLALLPGILLAQQPAIITGRVTDDNARPISSATVTIPSLSVGATTRANGEYTILVPGARVQGQAVPLNVPGDWLQAAVGSGHLARRHHQPGLHPGSQPAPAG